MFFFFKRQNEWHRRVFRDVNTTIMKNLYKERGVIKKKEGWIRDFPFEEGSLFFIRRLVEREELPPECLKLEISSNLWISRKGIALWFGRVDEYFSFFRPGALPHIKWVSEKLESYLKNYNYVFGSIIIVGHYWKGIGGFIRSIPLCFKKINAVWNIYERRKEKGIFPDFVRILLRLNHVGMPEEVEKSLIDFNREDYRECSLITHDLSWLLHLNDDLPIFLDAYAEMVYAMGRVIYMSGMRSFRDEDEKEYDVLETFRRSSERIRKITEDDILSKMVEAKFTEGEECCL